MNINRKIAFKDEYKAGYPLVNLKPEHFDIQKGYKFSTAIFQRPVGDQHEGVATITLLNEFGDMVEQELHLEFQYTESQRIIKALEPGSFKLRDSALTLDHPRKISTIDFVSEFEDVTIKAVTPIHTDDPRIWKIELEVTIEGIKDVFIIDFLVNFDKTEAVSQSGQKVEDKTEQKIKSYDPKEVLSFDDVDELELSRDFAKGSPPVTVSPSVISARAGVKIIFLEYIPPTDIDSRKALFRVEYTVKGNKKKQSKLIGFSFNKTIREAADETIKTIASTDFRFLQKDRTVIPVDIKAEDFAYVGPIINLDIVDVLYNFDAIDLDWRFITVSIIVEFKSINYKIDKVLEFTYSKRDYVKGTFREIRQESESINIPKKFLTPQAIKLISEKEKKITVELMNLSSISKEYPYKKILSIKLTRFFPDSDIIIFTIEALEKRGNLDVVHVFEKTAFLEKTYNEYLLEKMKPEDIIVKQDALPLAPTYDIDMRAFRIPEFAKLNAIQLSRPAHNQREMKIQMILTAGAGKKSRTIDKTLKFDLSEEEFIKYQQDMWERDYLLRIKPSDIIINIDTTDHPPRIVGADDIIGVPSGVDVAVDYQQPDPGTNSTRLFVYLTRGKQRVTFEQTIFFEKEAE